MDKKEKLLPQLLKYAGGRKILTYLSMVIAGIGQLLALAPFLYIWAIISMPLRAEGNSRWRSFGIGALSGVVEPVGGALVLFLASAVLGIMPFMLAFAAGAMLYVVVEELVPEYSQGKHSNVGTVGFALGFALMMVLDVVLG